MPEISPQSSPLGLHLDDISDLPPIPEKVRTPDGQEVDLTSDVWEFRRRLAAGLTLKINATALMGDQPSVRSLHFVRLYLAGQLQTKKAWTGVPPENWTR